MIINNDDKRCSLLNFNNLCDIYINLGEEYLCYTCSTLYMRALRTKDMKKEIVRLMISYSIIKMFLISTWVKNDYELTNEDIVEILYSASRNLEHNEDIIKAVYFVMKEQGLDSISNLVTMIY